MSSMVKQALSLLFPETLVFRRLPNRLHALALTFDDGPHPLNTPELLSVLAQENTPATFFLSGNAVDRYPDAAGEIHRAGHDIGNHGYSHRSITEIGIREYCADIEKGAEAITRVTEVRPKLFRPPYGALSLPLLGYLAYQRIACIGWTIDAQDSYLKDSMLLARAMKSRPVDAGDIVLLHEDYPTTIQAIGDIIRDLKDRGFAFARVSELLQGGRP